MDPKKRELLDRLFEEALALPREQQTAFLERECLDADLRQELQSLLAFATASSPVHFQEAIAGTAESLEQAGLIGHRVGPYRLISRIGVGGMGAVYRAARDDDQFQKTVAIKMLRFAHTDPQGVERFRRERQILATLEHPNIARLLDGGTWVPPGNDANQPYIAMEYVEGLPLTDYCEQNDLDIRERLKLFAQVCAAVSYAHQHLVVHRDIKPANILVTSDRVPKLLDFGIAKLLDTGEGMTRITATAVELRRMTPDYASPEQVLGNPVSTVTDVYSLGVVLYEMLTGRLPHRLSGHDPLDIVRLICDGEVQAPSQGRPELRGDIDVIVLTALQKEPARRYRSVEQFSEDIRRFLDGLPIVSRPDTLAYRAGMFVRRHRLGLAATAAVFVALLGGIAASTWQATRAARAERAALQERDRAVAEKQRADREAATAKAVDDFLQNDLLMQAGASAQADPNTKPTPDLKVRTALDRAAARITGKFQAQPVVEASIRQTIGKAYQDLGLFPEAQRQFEQSFELRKHKLGEEDESTLNVMNNLGELYWREGKYAQSEELLTKLLEIERRLLGEGRPETLNVMQDLANVYDMRGKYAQAEGLLVKVWEGRRRVLGPEHLQTLNAMGDLASVYYYQGKYRQSEELHLQALEAKRRVVGDEHPDTLSSLNNMATLYIAAGKYPKADELLTKLVSVQRKVLGDKHPQILTSMGNLGVVYLYEAKYPEAEALFTNLIDLNRRVLGAENPDTLITISNLSGLYFMQGKLADAERLTVQALTLGRRVNGPNSPDTLKTMRNLADIYRNQNRLREAEALLAETLEAQRRVFGDEHPSTLSTMESIGRLYQAQGQYAKAEESFARALRARRRILGEDHLNTVTTLVLLGRVQLQHQQYVEAESTLREAVGKFEKSIPDSWRRYQAQALLGATLAAGKNYAEAEPLLVGGYEGMVQRQASIPVNDRTELRESADRIIRLYEDSGEPQQAAEWRAKIQQESSAAISPK